MAAETSIVTGLTERYAKALFEMASDAGMLDVVSADLGRLQGLLRESVDLTRLVESPVISRADQARGLDAVLEKAELHDLVRRFVSVVAANRRLVNLARMMADFKRLLARQRGEMLAEVTSATPLNPAQVSALSLALKAAMGQDVRVEPQVDPSLMGGLIVQVGSRRMDSSIKNQLETLQVAMKGVA